MLKGLQNMSLSYKQSSKIDLIFMLRSVTQNDLFLFMLERFIKITSMYSTKDMRKTMVDLKCPTHSHVKSSVDDFVSHFNKLIQSFKENTFDSRCPIPVGTNNCVENGIHRLAICYANNILPEYSYLDTPSQGYPYQLFTNMKPEYHNTLLLEACTSRPALTLISVFPAANPIYTSQIEDYLQRNGTIFSTSSFKITDKGLFNYVKECYRGENWATDEGVRYKASKCSGLDDLRVCLFFSNIPLQTIKDQMREIYGVRDSVHVHDNQEQKMRLAKFLFHKNTFAFHNQVVPKLSPKNQQQFSKYSSLVGGAENYAIDSSFIMSLYNLREANDLDYVSFGSTTNIRDNDLDCHNDHFRQYEKTPIKAILEDESNYFYHAGVKLLNLKYVEVMKDKRKEGKDFKDLELIRSISKTVTKKRGVFFVFEGPDASGKTTHLNLTHNYIQQTLNSPCQRLYFPNRKTHIGKLLDNYLQQKETYDDETLQLLFAANRREMQKQIESLLKNGIHILCDRYYLSGLAYSELDQNWCLQLDKNIIRPDVTLLFHPVFTQDDGGEIYHTQEKQTKVWKKFQSFELNKFIQVYPNTVTERQKGLNDMLTNILKTYVDGALTYV